MLLPPLFAFIFLISIATGSSDSIPSITNYRHHASIIYIWCSPAVRGYARNMSLHEPICNKRAHAGQLNGFTHIYEPYWYSMTASLLH
jgi:hypothetical protein